jgi:hypothetical protein
METDFLERVEMLWGLLQEIGRASMFAGGEKREVGL